MTMTDHRDSLTAAAWSGPFELPVQTPVIRPSSLLEVVSVIDDDIAFGHAAAGATSTPMQGEVITVVDTDPSEPTVDLCGLPIRVGTEVYRDGVQFAVSLERTCSGPAAQTYADKAVDALIDNEGTILEHLVWEALTGGVAQTATDPVHALALIESGFPLTLGDAGVLLLPSAAVPYFSSAGLLAYDNTRKVFTYGGIPVAVMTADSDPLVPEAVWVPTFTVWRSTLDSYPVNNLAVNDFTTVATRSYLLNLQRDLAVYVTVP